MFNHILQDCIFVVPVLLYNLDFTVPLNVAFITLLFYLFTVNSVENLPEIRKMFKF